MTRRTALRAKWENGDYDIALEYNRAGKYWYSWVPKEPSIAVCKDSDMGECLHKLSWEIEAHIDQETTDA